MPPEPVLLVLTTLPDSGAARELAECLVGEGLAACVNQIQGVQSVYRWQGELARDSEVMMLIKTTEGQYATLERRLLELHPYELPEILAIAPAQGLGAYLDWIGASCR